MTTNPERTGCGARFIDLLIGLAVGWSCAAYFFGRLANPPRTHERAEMYGVALGALVGVLLPEIVRLLERARVPREASRTTFSLIAAAILGAAYGQIFENGCIRGMLTLSFAACVLFFLDAVVGGSNGMITPLAWGAKKELTKLLLKAMAGLIIGAIGGLLRLQMKVVAVTSTSDLKLFVAIVLITGVVTYPLLLLLFQGRKAVHGAKVIIPILDGLLFAVVIVGPMTQATSANPSWIWTWVPLGMMLGVMSTLVIGGLQSILLLLVEIPAARFASGVVADGIGKLLGRPRQAKDVEVEAALTPVQRSASGCVGSLSFVGIICFGLMALCFGGGDEVFSKDDKDRARLPPGCPPSCTRGDYSGWSLARTEKLQGANFDKANLQSAVLWDTDLSRATFRDARMSRVKLNFAQLPAADLTGADLRGAQLMGAKLQGAVLRNANLEGALLQRADLSGATLRDAKLTDAVFDKDTVWPAKFDPRAAGARMDGEK